MYTFNLEQKINKPYLKPTDLKKSSWLTCVNTKLKYLAN